jgi:hypothetical protein
MGSMSWSDDTRCLYCEGRLPLYRKITHGQFCSSEHRKAYWKEQERLAVERLQQTHITLSSQRPLVVVTPAELHRPLEPVVAETPHEFPVPEFTPGFAHEFAADVPEHDIAVPDMSGMLVPHFAARSGSAPSVIAADPFEYETAPQLVRPAALWSASGTQSLPPGKRVAAWSCVAPQAWTKEAPAASGEFVLDGFDGVLCHPRSSARELALRGASKVRVPLAASSHFRPTPEVTPASLQPLEVALAPSTHVALEVRPENDVLVQLLDQQVPQPDQLLETILPMAGTGRAIAPAYQLGAGSLHDLSGVVAAHAGSFASRATAETEARAFEASPAVAMSSAVMPAVVLADAPAMQESSDLASLAGLQSLPTAMVAAAQGTFANQASAAAILTAPGDITLPVTAAAAATSLTPSLTTLVSLPFDHILPAIGNAAGPMAANVALDLSSAVSGDLALPAYSAEIATDTATPGLSGFLPLPFGHEQVLGEVPRPEPMARLIPQSFEMPPCLTDSRLEPMDRKPAEDALRNRGGGVGDFMRGHGLQKLEPAWAQAAGFFQHAPRDLKLLLFAIPALLALVFHPGLPHVAFAAPQSAGGFTSQFKRVVSEQFVGVRQTLENRAAIALDEDFRSGLDNWVSPGGSTTEWTFDQSGFVQPGPLALYRPSVMLADYQLQFMGLVDKKAMSWVVRAADFENFYVVKLEIVKPGAIPTMGLTRYAVINGKAQDRHDVNIPLSARADTLYNIRMDVRGSNFNVEVQGQMADSWTESRLARGGVGFFTARGEASRVRWVQITHQYDMLGRLCAYLAPYDTTNGSWQP